jgi:hypothetical protein
MITFHEGGPVEEGEHGYMVDVAKKLVKGSQGKSIEALVF